MKCILNTVFVVEVEEKKRREEDTETYNMGFDRTEKGGTAGTPRSVCQKEKVLISFQSRGLPVCFCLCVTAF